jgi:putative ABC transport system substrate-binding protein
MKRRLLLQTLAGWTASMALPRAAGAVSATERKFRLMMILWRGETPVERGFRQELGELGVVAEYQVRDLAQNLDRLPAVLAEARRTRPDLLYTWGTGITLETVGPWRAVDATRHITDIPVVFTMVSDPEGTGLQPPPGAPPRPNVTGVSHIAPLAAQINAIRAYLPLRRLGIVYNPRETNSTTNVQELQTLAATMAFELLEAPVPLDDDGFPDWSAILRGGVRRCSTSDRTTSSVPIATSSPNRESPGAFLVSPEPNWKFAKAMRWSAWSAATMRLAGWRRRKPRKLWSMACRRRPYRSRP